MKRTASLRSILLASGFLLAGLILGVWWSPLGNQTPTPHPVAPHASVENSLHADYRSLRAEMALLQSENRRLRHDLASERQVATATTVARDYDPTPKPLDSSGPDEAALALAQRIQARMETRIEARLDALDAFLHLQDSQRERIRELLARRTGPGGWGMGAGERFDMDGAMREVLDDAQFEAYLEQSQESIYQRAEASATANVDRLTDSLGLSPEQQAAAFETLHVLTQEALIARETGEEFSYADALRERFDGILTPEQMESAEIMRFFDRPRFGGGRGRGPDSGNP